MRHGSPFAGARCSSQRSLCGRGAVAGVPSRRRKQPGAVAAGAAKDSRFERRRGGRRALAAAELISPGGDARRARDARRKLDTAKNPAIYAPLARGVDDWVHGRLRSAPESLHAGGPGGAQLG